MESFFDNQFQFMKHFDVKAQGKPQRKKKWLLSRQYLQPLNEPDDEDSARDDQDDSPASYKKKLKCAYEAAKYGMKEGVLTGVFLGGCWGIFKQLGENFTVTFRGSGTVGDEQGGERNEAGISAQRSIATSRRSSRKEPSLRSITSTERNRSPTLKSSDGYQDSISNYKKTMSIIREKSREKNYYNGNAANRLVYKYANSKLPIRSEKEFPPLNSVGASIYDPRRFNFRSKEKVEIVGYAFIQTTGSITGVNSGSDSIKSNGSDSPKNTGSTTKKDDESKTSSDDKIKMTTSRSSSNKSNAENESASVIGTEENKSVQSARQSVKSVIQSAKSGGSSGTGSRQSIRNSVGSSVVKSTKCSSGKSSGSIVVSSGDIISSQTSTKGIEHSRSTLPDVVEETQNASPANTNCSGNIQSEDNLQQRIVEESNTSKVSSFEGAVVKQESKISGISNLTYSNCSYQEFRKAVKETGSNANYNYNQGNRENSAEIVFDKFTPERENIYPDPKKTAAVLVDADKIGNGFTSPQMDAQSRQNRSQFSEEKAASHTSTAYPTSSYSDGANSNELVSKSPDYINSGSKTSAVSWYRVESSPKFTRSSFSSGLQAEEKYVVESTPSCDRSYVCDSEDRRYTVKSSPDYIRSSADTGSRISASPTITYEAQEEKRYSAEESFVCNSSYVSETQEGRSRKSSSPLYSRSHVSETQDETGFTLSRSPTYTKSYVSGLQDEGMVREESFHSRMNMTAAESFTRSTKSSKPSGLLFSSRDKESVHSSAGYVKSYISAAPSQEKYSGGSRASRQEKYSGGSRAPSQEKYSGGSRAPSQEKYSGGSRAPSQEKYSGGSRAQSKSAFEEKESTLASTQYSALPLKDKPSNCNEFSAGSHRSFEREVSAGAVADVASAGGIGSTPKGTASEKVGKQEESAKKRGFSFFSAVNENIIVLSACNCAIVLGVVCSVISTARASLAV